ncbi:16S rRNA (cytosine(967)-C(5))-methyltransferase RsmB [Alkalihalobacillus sp. AL-G]|uniref:16S rRNA (cytosine(967)-C(5))-methyltransferase RsmB n=1 Tax=Alkalihalobacillus sp. AL-G TaxID=2926399 RepID=UPI00272B32BE|nr:16S rRNA (cytosine(967)-C(5))-methyltransferase RsmB [Alkalihalobacillus sp. AL-G]WLD95105.1 16S rRNA (cytosine(967)-C(5))-methyltransferase RsmB [Alkalihalobacillus sp. AL-G]
MSKNVREAATDILLQIERSQSYSNLLLNKSIQQSNLSGKDVGLLTEMVYGTIQRKNTLDYYLGGFIKKPLSKLEDWVCILLRLSVYQMVYLDRVPDHAIINEAVTIAKKRGHKGISGFVNGVLRNIQRNGVPSIEDAPTDLKRKAIKYSHPEWMIERWTKQYGDINTTNMCKVNLEPPSVTARVNSLEGSVPEVIEALKTESVVAQETSLSPDGIQIISGQVPTTNVYHSGKMTIQDESSMLVGLAVNPQPGERVLDACAAPGGKTTHLSERMENKGKITAIDLHPHKVKLIDDQLKRLKLTNVDTVAMDTRQAAQLMEAESFDRILLDAPCTGLGVIRRKPDIKWTKTSGDIERIQSVQAELLDSVSRLLKPGGLLVYSTCTIEKEENRQQIDRFLINHPEFEWDTTFKDRMPEKVYPFVSDSQGDLQLLPQYFDSDGFYIACLRKTSRKGGETKC